MRKRAYSAAEIEALRRLVAEGIVGFRAIAERCWAEQDSRRPVLSLIRRLRARQAAKFADRLERALGGFQ